MAGEPNEVVWRGVRPIAGIRGVWPDIDAVRVIDSAYQAGAGSLIIYTVPAGKILFVTSAFLAARYSGAANAWGAIGVRDALDAHQYWFAMVYIVGANSYNTPLSYFPAVEVPAGYDVYVRSGDALLDANGIINGWIEDA